MEVGLTQLQSPRFLVVLGDQVAGGYNATGLNMPGGKGYGRLLLNNHPDYSAWAGHDLATLFPGIDIIDLARDGSTTNNTRANLERAITLMVLPAFIEGDLVVLIHSGGNDFFSGPKVMLEPEAVEAAASLMRANLAMMISLLRMRYEKPGRAVVVLAGNVIDPTDGTGMIPATFQQGSCRWLTSPQVVAGREQVLANLEYFNSELEREATVRGAWLVDAHAAFLGHGLNAGADCWLDSDGQKLLDPGHEALRRIAWKVLTGREPAACEHG